MIKCPTSLTYKSLLEFETMFCSKLSLKLKFADYLIGSLQRKVYL